MPERNIVQTVKNKFGSGDIYEAADMSGNIYATCAACMSIYAEFLSWANGNKNRFVCEAEDAISINPTKESNISRKHRR